MQCSWGSVVIARASRLSGGERSRTKHHGGHPSRDTCSSKVEIVVHLPEELADTVVAAAPGSAGMRMTPSELMRHAAPAGFFTLGWKAENVAPDMSFGCNLIRR